MRRRDEIEREEARRAAILDEWLKGGKDRYPRLLQFRRACDRGAVPGLGPEDFDDAPADTVPPLPAAVRR